MKKDELFVNTQVQIESGKLLDLYIFSVLSKNFGIVFSALNLYYDVQNELLSVFV